MKEALMMNAESVIELLTENEVQSIDIRGAIIAAENLKSAINGIDPESLSFKEKEEVKVVKKMSDKK